jgi:hypothetical protein
MRHAEARGEPVALERTHSTASTMLRSSKKADGLYVREI